VSTINWTGTRSDYTAKVDGYTLRAEMLDRGMWWWCCYMPDGTQRDVYTAGRYAKNGNAAKQSAIEAMNEHRNKP
jgi:hypothetical protein